MPRALTSDRRTPHFDRWLDQLRRRLEPEGARIDLIWTLSGGDTSKHPRWRMFLWKMFHQGLIPDGENLLAISEWMNRRPPGRRPAVLTRKNGEKSRTGRTAGKAAKTGKA